MLEFQEGTLGQSGQFLVSVLNKFLLSLPEKDTKVGQRLAIQILEEADVASQKVIAQAIGLSQARSLRRYKQALREEGLAGLFDRPRSGRPPITTQSAVEQGLMELILEGLLKEQTLPDDESLAQKLNDSALSQTQKLTPSMVQSIRLRLGIKRVRIRQLLATDQGTEISVLPSLLTLDNSCPQVSIKQNKTGIEVAQEKKLAGLLGRPELSQKDKAIQSAQKLNQKLSNFSNQLLSISRFPPFIFTNFLIYLLLAYDLTFVPGSDMQLQPAGFRAAKNHHTTNSCLLLSAPNGVKPPESAPIPIPKSTDCCKQPSQSNQNNCNGNGKAEGKTELTQPLLRQQRPEVCQTTEQRTPLISATTCPSASTKRYIPKSIATESAPVESQVRDEISLGSTQSGGAFILLALLIESGWLALSNLLPIAKGYAVTATQWLLTAIFAVIFGIKRPFHLDDCLDVGFALVTGRTRPLSHSTYLHLLHSFDSDAIIKFCTDVAKGEVEDLPQKTHRVSVDGHNLARYTKVVDLPKGKIGNSGRILKAEEMVLAFELDEKTWLAMRTYHGTNKLSTALLEIMKELQGNRPEDHWRVFFDKGGYKGLLLLKLKDLDGVNFYVPAKRTIVNVRQWEAIESNKYTTITLDKDASLPKAPSYKMADIEMNINVYQGRKIIGTVTLRAIVLHDPMGEKLAARWPFVLLTDDEKTEAQKLINEYGDHWAQEIGHRVGRHDLFLDVLPTGYKLNSQRNDKGELVREVEFDQSAFLLSAWLRLKVYNLISGFGKKIGGGYDTKWAGTLLRKFIHRRAELYVVDKQLMIVFDPFPEHEKLHPLLVELNHKRISVPWLNSLVLQFAIAEGPIYPLKEPQKRNRLFGHN